MDSFANFVVFGDDGKPYPKLGALYPGKGTTDGVAWLLWLGRWNQDPEKGAENLRSCFDTCWKQGKRGLGISDLCRAGYRGKLKPLAEEVKEARQLLAGEPRPIPGGRFTLADTLDYDTRY